MQAGNLPEAVRTLRDRVKQKPDDPTPTEQKLFKKNDTQPKSVKEKVRRPRYDPKERDLWKDLYD